MLWTYLSHKLEFQGTIGVNKSVLLFFLVLVIITVFSCENVGKSGWVFILISCCIMSMQHNPKACAIFSRVRQGKAYVNDLPTVLHILKIPMNDSEMRQVLKTVDIDGEFSLKCLAHMNVSCV